MALLGGCSGLEQSEQEKLRRKNVTAERIYRAHDEYAYALDIGAPRLRKKYPWEETYAGKHAKITKEFFQCKGSSVNPPHENHKDPARQAHYFDCGGGLKHSLPLRDNREFVYPILLDLLNHVQSKTQSRVIVTCGYRCPTHNAYADPSTYNQNSKHMIGAEVDFYVQGWEGRPQEVLQILMQYYQENPLYAQEKSYREFLRLDQAELNVSTPPWYNKEILIKLYQKSEGRDLDNRHPYPYLSIQVRYDREKNEKVVCNWQTAFSCYRRY